MLVLLHVFDLSINTFITQCDLPPHPTTAGKDPSAADISALISSVGAEADAAQVELLLKELDGKVRADVWVLGLSVAWETHA